MYGLGAESLSSSTAPAPAGANYFAADQFLTSGLGGQVNLRAGHLPEPEDNQLAFIKIPLDTI